LPKEVFLRFCERYYTRNNGKRKSSNEKRVLSEFIEWLCEEYPEQVIKALAQSSSGKRIAKQVTGSA